MFCFFFFIDRKKEQNMEQWEDDKYRSRHLVGDKISNPNAAFHRFEQSIVMLALPENGQYFINSTIVDSL